MISFDEAKQIAIRKIGPDCVLSENETIEKPYGWYFCFQSKAYLQSGQFQDMLVGSGGFIVEREDGYIFEFGSAYPPEYNLAAYEAGFRYETYDLTILSVTDRKQTVWLLFQLNMSYVVVETEYGIDWKVPKQYTEAQIKAALATTPCTFSGHNFFHKVNVIAEIDRSKCCEYQLLGHRAGRPAILLDALMLPNRT
jgi:hypothetical protein